ncbi:hypothetical protein J2X72_003427 [Phyllobacterium sp. 1468]|nr:hypothetical protein [Phyllobacterium sp. 1468]
MDVSEHDYTKKLTAAVPVPDPARPAIKCDVAADKLKTLFGPSTICRRSANIVRCQTNTSFRSGDEKQVDCTSKTVWRSPEIARELRLACKYDRCVAGERLRLVMSSIMRRRNG